MPTTSDFIIQSTDATDVDNSTVGVDTRLRVGHPRLTVEGTTPTDAKIARNATTNLTVPNEFDENDVMVAPAATDALVDVKRALQFTPHTGFNLTTGGRFNAYTKSNFEARVLDGAAIFQVVDQTYQRDPADATRWKLGLTYFRLGKPEPQLNGSDGQPLDRSHDLLKDQKYQHGVGLFTDAGINVWARDEIKLKSNKSIYLLSDDKTEETYGENAVYNYEYQDSDIAALRSGAKSPAEVNRKIVNVSLLRSTDLGWYKLGFDRGRNITYSTSNKGDFSIGMAYAMSVGGKFDHNFSVGLSTAFTGQVEVSGGSKVEIGSTGATFKHPFGSFIQENEASISANAKVTLTIAGIDNAPLQLAMTNYYIALQVAIAAQNAGFMLYNASLAGQADRTITPEQSARKDEHGNDMADDAHGFRTSLEQGMKIYEAALSLSAISCAAGLVLAAVQAAKQAIPPPPGMMPKITINASGIYLTHGANGIAITPTGVKVVGLGGGVTIGGVMIETIAPSIQDVVGSPMPILAP